MSLSATLYITQNGKITQNHYNSGKILNLESTTNDSTDEEGAELSYLKSTKHPCNTISNKGLFEGFGLDDYNDIINTLLCDKEANESCFEGLDIPSSIDDEDCEDDSSIGGGGGGENPIDNVMSNIEDEFDDAYLYELIEEQERQRESNIVEEEEEEDVEMLIPSERDDYHERLLGFKDEIDYDFIKKSITTDHRHHHNITFNLPKIPNTDIDTMFTKIPTYFGTSIGDVEWNRYATEYYDALKVINKTITYWINLVVHNKLKWEKVLEYHTNYKKTGSVTTITTEDKEEEKEEDDDDKGETDIHYSCKSCLGLDPFNLNTGLHFCYHYWLKVTSAALLCYENLIIYYLKGNTINNFTKIVKMPGFKNKRTGEYCYPHQTSMAISLCMEINRLRLVCRASKIWPLSMESYAYYLNKDFNTLSYANNMTLIRSQKNKTSPIVPSRDLYSFNKASQSPSFPPSLYKQQQGGTVEYMKEAKLLKVKMDEVNYKEQEFTSKILYNIVKEHNILPITVLEELVGGLVWRFNTVWQTSLYNNYLDWLLDKTSLYYLGAYRNEIMDDILFRQKVPNNNNNNNNPNMDKDHTNSKEMFIINQDFLYYTNCLISELHLTKYYNTRYDQRKWSFIGETNEDTIFKKQYFYALRSFFKYWSRHRRVTNTDMLRDTAGTKYSRLMTTQLEFTWFKYFTSIVLKDTSKLISTTNSKLIQVLRPFEKEVLSDMAGQEMSVLFDYHRTDPRYRGYGDWLRLLLSGSVFASSIPEFTTDNSKYILHSEQTLSNSNWFKQDQFPFIWYWGGRYHVYCNGYLWYVHDTPYDLCEYITKKRKNMGSNKTTTTTTNDYFTKKQILDNSSSGKFTLSKLLETESKQINQHQTDFDDHVYLNPDLEQVRGSLYHDIYDDDDDDDSTIGMEVEEEVDDNPHINEHTTSSSVEYHYISTLTLKELDKVQAKCIKYFNNDNGDTLYDTLALWAFMAQENSSVNPKLAKAIIEGLRTSCEILLKKVDSMTQKDLALLQITPNIQHLLQYIDRYEREYCDYN